MSSAAHRSLVISPGVRSLIDLALEEDVSGGDVTADCCSRAEATTATIAAEEPMVVCGLPVINEILSSAAPDASLQRCAEDGQRLDSGSVLVRLDGPTRDILLVERTVLNFLSRMTGVATLTRAYVDAVAGTGTRILDTRKTVPGWRLLDKYAVRCGGGFNHRANLAGGILIKDNHIESCGSVAEAVGRAQAGAYHGLKIEVEVETIDQVDEALAAGADILQLDNMTPAQVREAVGRIDGRAEVGVSGGVTLETVRDYAEAGPRWIAIGALTHSAPAASLTLHFESTAKRA